MEIVENDPIFALVYIENLLLRGDFTNVLITDSLDIESEFRAEHLIYDYFKNIEVESDKKKFKHKQKNKKDSDDLKLLKNKEGADFQTRFLSYILNKFEVDTTVIVFDSDDFEMVSEGDKI